MTETMRRMGARVRDSGACRWAYRYRFSILVIVVSTAAFDVLNVVSGQAKMAVSAYAVVKGLLCVVAAYTAHRQLGHRFTAEFDLLRDAARVHDWHRVAAEAMVLAYGLVAASVIFAGIIYLLGASIGSVV